MQGAPRAAAFPGRQAIQSAVLVDARTVPACPAGQFSQEELPSVSVNCPAAQSTQVSDSLPPAVPATQRVQSERPTDDPIGATRPGPQGVHSAFTAAEENFEAAHRAQGPAMPVPWPPADLPAPQSTHADPVRLVLPTSQLTHCVTVLKDTSAAEQAGVR